MNTSKSLRFIPPKYGQLVGKMGIDPAQCRYLLTRAFAASSKGSAPATADGSPGTISDSSLAYSKSYPFALPLILWCDKFDDHLLRCISLSNFQMVDFGLLWYDLSLGQWTSITSCSDPYRTWSRHGSRGSGYTSSSIQSSQSSRSGVAWQCTRPQHRRNPACYFWFLVRWMF